MGLLKPCLCDYIKLASGRWLESLLLSDAMRPVGSRGAEGFGSLMVDTAGFWGKDKLWHGDFKKLLRFLLPHPLTTLPPELAHSPIHSLIHPCTHSFMPTHPDTQVKKKKMVQGKKSTNCPAILFVYAVIQAQCWHWSVQYSLDMERLLVHGAMGLWS